MKHSQAARLIEGYEPSELSVQVREDLSRHLVECADCSTLASEMASLKDFSNECAAQFQTSEFEAGVAAVRLRTLRAIREMGAQDATPFDLRAWMGRLGLRTLAAPAAVAAALAVGVMVQQAVRTRTPVAPSATVASTQSSEEFKLVRDGNEVRIEWPRNGQRQHTVRTGQDPVAVHVADGSQVRGKVWSERPKQAAPGSVTYYLID